MTIPLSALWLDADAVGRMLSLSGRVVRERIALRPDFPKPALPERRHPAVRQPPRLPSDQEQPGDSHPDEHRAREVEHLRRSRADLAQPVDGAHRRRPPPRRRSGHSPRVSGFSQVNWT